MKHVLNFLRKRNDGYVSIEVVIIGGLVVGLGALTIDSFHKTGTVQVNNSVNTVEEKFNSPQLKAIWDR